jgi:hypothetical protein
MDTQENTISSLLEDMKTIKEILAKVADNNDIEIKQTGHLRTSLFNLQITGKRHNIPEIEPIALAVERVIDTLHSGTMELVNHDRDKLHACIQRINNFLEYQNNLCVFETTGCCNCEENRKPYCSKKILVGTKKGIEIQKDFYSCLKEVQGDFNKKYDLY